MNQNLQKEIYLELKELVKFIIEMSDKELQRKIANALILAKFFNDENSFSWLTVELNGYSDKEILPSYRKLKGILLRASDLKPMKPYLIPDEVFFHSFDINWPISKILEIINSLKSTNNPQFDQIYGKGDFGIYSIQMKGGVNYGINRRDFLLLISSINSKLIELGIEYNSKLEGVNSDQDENISIKLEILQDIFERFNRFYLQTRQRYNNREPLFSITDEYDIQDIVHALLKLHFDDIRPEDYIPEHAGSKSKIDFLLKKEKILIEIKITSEKLDANKLGKQLRDDIPHYKNHPDCKYIIFFIYDPLTIINNRKGFISDIEGMCDNSTSIIVWFSPLI